MPLKLVPPRPGKTDYWYVRGTIYGQLIFASTKKTDQKAAQRIKEQFELALAKQDTEKRSPATFRIAAARYANYRKPNKWDQVCIDRLISVIGDTLLSDISQDTLLEAANLLYPRATASTKNRQAIVPASAILHYSAENKLCSYMRVRKFKEKSPEPRSVSKETAKRLIDAADGELRAFLVWLFHQGWRVSDVLRIQWSDIDIKQRTVRYHISKTDDWRVMPLHAKTVEAITALSKREGRLFHWSDKSNLYRDLRPFCAELGIKFTPHMARHSFATWLANEGISTLELMEAGGWKDHKSVLRYAKLDPTRVRTIIDKIVE